MSVRNPFLILFAAALLFLPVQAAALDTFSGTVVEVLEGDYIRVLYQGKYVNVRLSDIDCPEVGQPYGREAKRFTAMLSFSGPVKVTVKGVDSEGIKVGEVVMTDAGLNLNQELMKAGLAWWVRKGDAAYGDLEKTARTGKIGLWKEPNPIPPWEFKKKHP